MKWFTADLHFWHKGIISMCRPWATSVEMMNEVIINSINSWVRAEDELYILGDLSFGNRLNTIACVGQLNGRLKVVPGNHDNPSYLRQMHDMKLIELLPPLCQVKDNGQMAVLCHFPLLSWNEMQHGSWNLHGHCHGNLKHSYGKRLDVGYDVWEGPVNWDFLIETMSHEPIYIVDHHKEPSWPPTAS